MPGYRRFVTYLFQYENGRKGRNCGFAKVEVRQDKCRIEIQVKGYQDQKLPVYLFAGKAEKPEGAYLGEVTVKNGMGGAVFLISAEVIGNTPYGIDDMRGLYLKEAGDSFAASQWDDADTDWDAFVPYEESMVLGNDDGEENEMEGTSGEISEVDEKKETEEIAGTVGEKEIQQFPEKPDKCDKQDSEPELHATQAVPAAAAQPYSNADAWEQQWRRFTAAHPVFCPFDEDEGVYGVKMNLRDFKILPKQYWYLANNSFLLHGYFNYRYILFGYMGDEYKKWFLGVPGTFQNQEQILAGAFGFPEFRTKQLTRQKTGEFGYWYRYLDL